MNFEAILTGIGSSSLTAIIIAQVLSWRFNARLERLKNQLERERTTDSHVWQMKRAACLRALNAANAVLSNYTYQNAGSDKIIPQYESVESIRAVFNELACTCDSPEVTQQLKRILFEPVTPAAIIELRNAVRRELGFTNSQIEIDTDDKSAFLGRVNCHPQNAMLVPSIAGDAALFQVSTVA